MVVHTTVHGPQSTGMHHLVHTTVNSKDGQRIDRMKRMKERYGRASAWLALFFL